jgi:hypothetical protein
MGTDGPKLRLVLAVAALSICLVAVVLCTHGIRPVELVTVPDEKQYEKEEPKNPSSWGYDDDSKEEGWAEMWPICGSGKSQVLISSLSTRRAEEQP